MDRIDNIEGVLFDLDGVLYVGDKLIPGAVETIEKLKKRGLRLRFLTNTTTRSLETLHEKLTRLELPIELSEVFAPPKMGAHYLRKIGKPTVRLILEENTKTEFAEFPVDNEKPEYIVLGHYGERWDYRLMSSLFQQVMSGSKMLALHKGRFWQTEEGLTLDIGAFVVGLEHATGQQAIAIGKPSETFFHMALEDMGVAADRAIMIGDDLINDISGAQNAGIRAVLVKTGKYREEILNQSGVRPDKIIESVADVTSFL